MRTLLLASLATACAVDPPSGSDPGGGKGDVWGSDDRMERYELTTKTLRDVAHSSLATANPRDLAYDAATDTWSMAVPTTLKDDQHLCDGQRFADQPVLADCSATLIAPDIVLTAGHCFESADCSATMLIQDFAYDAVPRDPMKIGAQIPSKNVFRCAEMLAWKFTAQTSNDGHDYALLRLDHAAEGTPVHVNWNGSLAAGTPIYTIGYPAGIPLKVAPGKVLDPMQTAEFFTHDSDVFGGTSGGGIFDRQGTLLGLHSGSSGQRYIPGPTTSCNVAAVCDVNATCDSKPSAYDVRALGADLSPALRARLGVP